MAVTNTLTPNVEFVPCPVCDFSSGKRSGAKCGACDGQGDLLRAGDKLYVLNEAGLRMAIRDAEIRGATALGKAAAERRLSSP